MRDTGGKSGRRPGRHLQVEASGPRNAASVQQRLAGRFRGGEIAQGRARAVWPQVDAPELSSGPVCEIQEVSRVGAQGVTSKSKLLAQEMPRVCSRGLRVDSKAVKSLKVAPAQPGSRLDAPLASYGSRATMQCVTSAQHPARDLQVEASGLEKTQLRTGGSRIDSEAAKLLKVALAQSGPKSVRRSSPWDLGGRYRR